MSSSTSASKFFNSVDRCSLQAVERTNGKLQFFDSHLECFFLLVFFLFNHDFHVLGCIGKLYEQVQMLLHDLCCRWIRLRSGVIDPSVQISSTSLVIVCYLSYSGILDCKVYFSYRSVNRVYRDHRNRCVFVLVHLRRNISSASCKIDFHDRALRSLRELRYAAPD